MESPYDEKPRRRRASIKLGVTRSRSKRVHRSTSIPSSPRHRSLPPTPSDESPSPSAPAPTTTTISRSDQLYEYLSERLSSHVESIRDLPIMDRATSVYERTLATAYSVVPYILTIPSTIFALINLVVFNLLLSVFVEISSSFMKTYIGGSKQPFSPPIIPNPTSTFYSPNSKAFSLTLSTELSLLFATALLSKRTGAKKYINNRIYDVMGLVWSLSGIVTTWLLGTVFLLAFIGLLLWLLLISGSPWIAIILEEVIKVVKNGVMGLLKRSGAGWIATRAVETALGYLKL